MKTKLVTCVTYQSLIYGEVNIFRRNTGFYDVASTYQDCNTWQFGGRRRGWRDFFLRNTYTPISRELEVPQDFPYLDLTLEDIMRAPDG